DDDVVEGEVARLGEGAGPGGVDRTVDDGAAAAEVPDPGRGVQRQVAGQLARQGDRAAGVRDGAQPGAGDVAAEVDGPAADGDEAGVGPAGRVEVEGAGGDLHAAGAGPAVGGVGGGVGEGGAGDGQGVGRIDQDRALVDDGDVRPVGAAAGGVRADD